MAGLELLSLVALNDDVPAHGLRRGQVGTIVERLSAGTFEVEFNDDNGFTYAMAPLSEIQLIPLLYKPADRAA